MTRKKHDPVSLKSGWLRFYKVFVFAVVIVLVWGVSPLVAARAFDISLAGILERLWFTLFWAGGLAYLFDMKASLPPVQRNFYKERSRYYAYFMGLVGAVVLAIAALVFTEIIQTWFRLEPELAIIISAIWSILVATAMAKAGLDLSEEWQKGAVNS